MQDIYAFDVGDYGKLGLLRHLTRVANLSLGVLWYRTDAGSIGADGKHVGYLKDKRYAAPDSELWCAMGERFGGGERRIEGLEPFLPTSTVFHRLRVPTDGTRQDWFQSAAALVKDADIVFCDPDNGVKFREVCRSVRHIGLAEIHALWNAGHSLVVYHHLNRSDSHGTQIASLLARFQRELRGLGAAFGAWFRRGSSRVFIVLAQQRHLDAIRRAMERFEASAWTRDDHFRIVHTEKDTDTCRRKDRDSGGLLDSMKILRAVGRYSEPRDAAPAIEEPTKRLDLQRSSPHAIRDAVEVGAMSRQRCKHGLDPRFCSVCSATEPRRAGASEGADLQEILQFLNECELRATYGAVAELLGVIPRRMGALLGGRRPYASWVVNAGDGWPTGYSADEVHQHLLRSAEIIDSGATLFHRLSEWRKRRP
jgi:hypothetical protein